MSKIKKFGTFGGVFTPSILTILGVIMYLRFPAILGQAGLINTIGIIVIAHIISITTGLSVASLSTDKPVQNGGTYFMISRSLGLPIGGTLGLALFVGLSFSVSLYLIGFSESFLQYWAIESNIQTIRITGTIILIAVTTITFISTSLAIKSQYFIMAAIVLSLISIFLGFGHHDYVPTEVNWAPLATSAPFMLLFGIFFPAVTGFEAGVSMSGDLKDPKKSLPYGAMLAVGVGFIVYIALALFYAFTVDAESLANDPEILFKIALSPTLVIAGIWGATLSSALGSILGAPRILQAIAQDKIVPKVFAKGTGETNEPRNALLLAFVIAEAGILIGDLDVIARIVSMFFITTYAFLNLAAAIESWSSSDYRPAFKIPKFVSILGTVSAFIVMILLDFIALAGAVVVLGLLFFYLRRQELILENGDAWSSFWTNLAKKSLLNLTKEKGNTRNWVPNILLFSSGEQVEPQLVEIGLSLTGKLGALTDFNLIDSQQKKAGLLLTQEVDIKSNNNNNNSYFKRDYYCDTVQNGIKTVSSVYGFSGFEPNTVLMEWSHNTQNLDFLADIIKDLKSKNLNTVFLDFDKNNGFGKKENIDIWWNGKGRFINFALNLLKFLLSDPSWRDVNTRILIISSQSSIEDSIISNTNALLLEKRIRAEVKVIYDDFGSITTEEIINAESSSADLLMLGISQNKSSYSTEYLNYINRLSNLPSSLLLLIPSNEFDEISLFENTETLIKKPEYRKEQKALSPLPKLQNNVITGKIEKLDADNMDIANMFIDKTINPVINSIEIIISQVNDIVILSKSNIEKEVDGTLNFSKTVSSNHQSFLRKACNQLEQNNTSILKHVNDTLHQGIINLIASIDKYALEAPKTVLIHIETKRRRGKDVKFYYKRFINYYFNTVLKLELNKILEELESSTISQTIQLRNLLFGINDTFEKIDLAKGSSYQELLKELDLNIKGFNEIQDDLLNLKIDTDSKILEVFHGLSVSISTNIESITNISKSQNKVKPKDSNEYLSNYANIFGQGFVLLNNSMYLDALLLSNKTTVKNILKSANNKIEKSVNEKFSGLVQKLISNTEYSISNKENKFKSLEFPDKISIQNIFEESWKSIVDINNSYLEDIELPEKIFNIDGYLSFSKYNSVHANIKKSSNYYIDSLFYEPYYRELQELENTINSSIIECKEAQSLLSFNFNNLKVDRLEVDSQFYNRLLKELRLEQAKVNDALKQMHLSSVVYLQNAFSKLFFHSIIDSETKINPEKRELKSRRLVGKVYNHYTNAKESYNRFIIYLINASSSGRLISKKYLAPKENSYTKSGDILRLVGKLIPYPKAYNNIPIFYRNLMSSSSRINDEFWIPRDVEFERIKDALQMHKRGFGGALLIKGVHGAGKTAISQYAVSHLYKNKKVVWIDAPIGGSTSIEEFLSLIQKQISSSEDFNTIFNNFSHETVVVINDLELWWERRTNGDIVINKIIELIQNYGDKVFFILNCNSHSFNILRKLTPLDDNCLSIIDCEPFNTSEIQKLILSRHKSSGISFEYKNQAEESVSKLSLSLLFNSYFNTTQGIPGVALNTWKSNIVDTKQGAISIIKPDNIIHEILLNMPPDWLIVLSLFIQHKQMDKDKLKRISGFTSEQVATIILNMKNAGILVNNNSNTNVMSIGRNIEPLIVETCLTKGII